MTSGNPVEITAGGQNVWPRATRPRVVFGTLCVRGNPIAGESPAATRFHQFSKDRSPGFKLVLQAQHGRGDGACLRASDAHNPDAASARRSGNGDDCVVEVHGEIVAGEGRLRAEPEGRAFVGMDGSETRPHTATNQGRGFRGGLPAAGL